MAPVDREDAPGIGQLRLGVRRGSDPDADERRCALCGGSLEGRRPDAVYCSAACRSAARNANRAGRRFAPDRPSCPVCGEPMSGRREGAIYCSSACRVRAWTARQRRPKKDHSKVAERVVQKRMEATVGRVTLTKREAAAALGISVDSFERHVQPELRVIRRGRMRLVPTRELERWAAENASLTLSKRVR
jgi:uncharacterized Zn finger protein (UPF0148 family)